MLCSTPCRELSDGQSTDMSFLLLEIYPTDDLCDVNPKVHGGISRNLPFLEFFTVFTTIERNLDLAHSVTDMSKNELNVDEMAQSYC